MMGLDVYVTAKDGENMGECPHKICRRWDVERDVIRYLFNGNPPDVKRNVSTFLKNHIDEPDSWVEKGVIGVFRVYCWFQDLYLSEDDIVTAD